MRNKQPNEKPKKSRRRRKMVQKPRPVYKGLPYTSLNIWLLVIGIGIAIFGLLFLFTGDTVISTISMVVGYTIIIPFALLWIPKKKRSKTQKAPERQQQP